MAKISFLFYEPVTGLRELGRRMELLATLGYRGVELSAAHPLGLDVEDIAASARRYGLPVVSLLSGWSYAHERLCLSSPDPSVRDRAVGRLEEYVGLAARLGSVLVVGLMQGLRADEPDEAKANERIAGCLARVAPTAETRGVSVVLEPVNHQQVGFNNTAAEAAAMADRVGSPALGYMLDTIHMNVEERSVLGTIRDHGGRIRHFHLCESNGGLFGTGHIDFPGVLGALAESGYNGFASVKVYRKASWEEAARASAEFFRGLGAL